MMNYRSLETVMVHYKQASVRETEYCLTLPNVQLPQTLNGRQHFHARAYADDVGVMDSGIG